MVQLGKKSVASLVRLVCISSFAMLLAACHSRPCEHCLSTPPAFPSNKLILKQKPLPIYQRRQYDLCLLHKEGVLVIQKGQTWTFVLPSDKLFENENAEFDPHYLPVLATAADFMKTYQKILVTVHVYSNHPAIVEKTKFGTLKDIVTREQADAVVKQLTAMNINARLIVGEGYGEKDPIAWNGSAYGRALNRRVEIHFRYYRDSNAWF